MLKAWNLSYLLAYSNRSLYFSNYSIVRHTQMDDKIPKTHRFRSISKRVRSTNSRRVGKRKHFQLLSSKKMVSTDKPVFSYALLYNQDYKFIL